MKEMTKAEMERWAKNRFTMMWLEDSANDPIHHEHAVSVYMLEKAKHDDLFKKRRWFG